MAQTKRTAGAAPRKPRQRSPKQTQSQTRTQTAPRTKSPGGRPTAAPPKRGGTRIVLGGALLTALATTAVIVTGRLLPDAEPVEATDELVPSQAPLPDSGLAAGIFVTDLRPDRDPGYESTPLGTCATITPDAISYRNDTGNLANSYLEIGRSRLDRPIWAEHWGSTAGPQLLVVGQVHGIECSPAWFVRAIRSDPPVDYGIWLVPTLNPDGLATHRRRNADDIDINRDGRRLKAPETRALIEFTRTVRPTLSIHIHSPLQWVGWHNSRTAQQLAAAITDATGWGTYYTSGVVESDRFGFLWEAQDAVLPGHPSVLIEFPAISTREATNYVNPEVNRYVSVARMDRVARTTLAAIGAFFGGGAPSG